MCVSTLATNPEYRQLVKDRETTKLRIAEMQRQQAAINEQVRSYSARVESATESKWTALGRVNQSLSFSWKRKSDDRKAELPLRYRARPVALRVVVPRPA